MLTIIWGFSKSHTHTHTHTHTHIYIYIYIFFFFNWGIAAFQCCVGFCSHNRAYTQRSHNLFVGGWFCLHVDGDWLIKVVVSFHRQFLCSPKCCLIVFYPENFQNLSQLSPILPLLYQLSLWHILNFNNLHSIFTRSRFYLKKPLSLLIRSNSSSINTLSWDCSNSVIP